MCEWGVLEQPIVGFEWDEEGHRVVYLACGYGRYMRHDSPWQLCPWTETEVGRASKINVVIERLKSDWGDPAE